MDELIQLILGTTRIDEAVYPDTPLISSGMIDSFDIVALLTTFENRYGIAISPEEVNVERFDTPEQMLAVITTLQG
jgi:D-alanine--poly(phosphoribitol) ligase subunit 2